MTLRHTSVSTVSGSTVDPRLVESDVGVYCDDGDGSSGDWVILKAKITVASANARYKVLLRY